ncbi:Fpg/Nei family DNA glycosylase [Bacillus sp. HMF5848]|uniref:Fpg/Nei family DNA glycosylase n=1 Tax=Bacillus sp. HMF5848 TaxID=2495421 RepID=UPI000F7AF168|nr:DNA-formamidopyrimidine glycosylase family protein [Bacillus sp. HMF5848]RSK27264.1 Fpg/Nei family DNA glycosylase [Bacillus sp. HMF5848]
MPELPEMETYKRLLTEKIVNIPIKDVIIQREKSINTDVRIIKDALIGGEIKSIERRAKHLVFRLRNKQSLLLHLMLGGWMYIGNEHDSPNRTKQITIIFNNGLQLFFIGLRLGYLHLLTDEQLGHELQNLGPEPLDSSFNIQLFSDIFNNKRGMLKTTLVNQEVISGIGNCYSDEIAYVAEVNPKKKINQFNDIELNKLFNSIKSTLNRAIDLGGYMENPLYINDQLTGGYNEHCYVYDREGKACFRCSDIIQKEIISSRKVFFCPTCQH